MTANIDVVGEKRAKVLTVPVEAIFKKDETEVVYVKKAEEPKKAAESGGFLAQRLRRGQEGRAAAASSTRRTRGRRSSSCARSRPASRASTRWRS